jgi:hypothetical protein
MEKAMAKGIPVMSADEKRWQAESDAETLKRAAQIDKDPKRRKAAENMLKKYIKDASAAIKKK